MNLIDFLHASTCNTGGCDRSGKLTRGMCSKHYRSWLTHTPKSERPTAPRFDRTFWDYVKKTHERGCWTWTGPTIKKGYGFWSGEGARSLAHRHSWTLANGPIPEDLWVLHHCDNPPCVNPAHLYLGTVVENVQDMVARGRAHVPERLTHCPDGHEKSGDNLRIVNDGGRDRWVCRICDNDRSRHRMAAQAARADPGPPIGLISTAQVLDQFDVSRSTFKRFRKRGLIQPAASYRREFWWRPEEIDALVANWRAA